MTSVRWILLSLIGAALFLFLLPQSAVTAGDDGYRHRHRATPSCVKDFWGRCLHVARHRHAYRWRYYHRHRRHHDDSYRHGRWYPGANERIDHGLICHARRRVVGEERPSTKEAERAAENAWMSSVRYDHGERYQDINKAKEVRVNCDPSSTVRPGLGAKFFTRPFFRCVVEATPCRGQLGDSEGRVERRYEEEVDEGK
jgi:hypothetical protein